MTGHLHQTTLGYELEAPSIPQRQASWPNTPSMGQVLHGSARTTEAVRRAIQLRQESVRALAKRFGVSPTTVQKWRKRTTTTDAPMGPKELRSTVLSREEEAIVVAFRRHTLLPLDDCLYALQPTIPHLTRSALHRCLQRHVRASTRTVPSRQ